LAGILILLFLWPARRSFDQNKPGEYFFLFLSFTAASILFLEFFRGDSLILLGGIRSKQVAAWGILAACLWILNKIKHSGDPEQQNNSLQDRG
jgi:prolipoprotein diacylglyceryltransferase